MPDQKCRWCFVPMCTNTSISSPEKVFIRVPTDIKRRTSWIKSVRRFGNAGSSMLAKHLYCCEDHFNLEEDMDNFVQFKLMKGKVPVRIRMKEGVTPHIFDCQTEIAGIKPSKSRNRKALFTGSYQEANHIDGSSNEDEDEEEEEEVEAFNVCDFLEMETYDSEDMDPLSSDCPLQVAESSATMPVGAGVIPDPEVTIKQDPDLNLMVKEEPIFLNETVEGSAEEFRQVEEEHKPRVVGLDVKNFTVDALECGTVRDTSLHEGTDYLMDGSRGISEQEDELDKLSDTRDKSTERAFGMFKRDVDDCETECVNDIQGDGGNEVFAHYPECVDMGVGSQETEFESVFVEPVNGMLEDCEYEKENVHVQGNELSEETAFTDNDVNFGGVEHSDKEAMLVYESENASDGFLSVSNFNEPEGIFVFESSNGYVNFGGNNGGNKSELETLAYKTGEVPVGGNFAKVENTDFVVVNNLDEVSGTFTYEIHNSDDDMLQVDPPAHVDETFVYETRNNDVDFVGVDKHDQANETMVYEGDNNSLNSKETGPPANDIHDGVYPVALWKFIPQDDDSTQDTSSNDSNSGSANQNRADSAIVRAKRRRKRKQTLKTRPELSEQSLDDDTRDKRRRYFPNVQSISILRDTHPSNVNNRSTLYMEEETDGEDEELGSFTLDAAMEGELAREEEKGKIKLGAAIKDVLAIEEEKEKRIEKMYAKDIEILGNIETLDETEIKVKETERRRKIAQMQVRIARENHKCMKVIKSLREREKMRMKILRKETREREVLRRLKIMQESSGSELLIQGSKEFMIKERIIQRSKEMMLIEGRRERVWIEGHRGETPMIKPSSGPTECGTCGKKLRRKQCFHVL